PRAVRRRPPVVHALARGLRSAGAGRPQGGVGGGPGPRPGRHGAGHERPAAVSQQEAALPRRALIGIFGGLFCGYMGLSAVIPVLPRFVREGFGAPDLAVGLAVTATGLAALLVRPVAGDLADRRGYRRVMQLGALIVCAGGVLYLLPIGLAGLVAVRLLVGVGEASLFTAGAGWTVSLAPHSRRGQLIGLYGVSMWFGI